MTRVFGIAVIALACVATTSGGRDGSEILAGSAAQIRGGVFQLQLEGVDREETEREEPRADSQRALPHTLRIPFLAADGIAIPEPAIEAQPVGGVTPIAQATATSLPAPNPLSIPERICEYSWPCGEALAVAECESTFNPWAENGVHLGLYQVNPEFHGWRLYPGESLLNPDVNMRVAHGIWQAEGWTPWNASRHCWGG